MLLLVLLPGNGNAKIKTFYKLRVVCGQEEGATLNVLRIALRFAMATDRNIGPSTSATANSNEPLPLSYGSSATSSSCGSWPSRRLHLIAQNQKGNLTPVAAISTPSSRWVFSGLWARCNTTVLRASFCELSMLFRFKENLKIDFKYLFVKI